ncbi:SDR family oxidoreductase [Streptomyces sp. TRM66268-LWL]|uniref:SDR family oxidoreductase n=1 Tax=Streptomyces polyasparticus TaxID=2767826 RepID=A0ABR7SCS8_9ACTN|nr:SDR family oxidoreductase [Streptomyces polyasparticus]MBC9712969.1 SDR family oxidoreductase [Streptomyces polyasparticus]
MSTDPAHLIAHFGLAGRNALVTGGSSGIGKAIATALARAGARVVLMARGAQALDETVDGLRAEGLDAAAVVADVGDREALHAAAEEAVEPYGEPDILVTSAGINLRPPLGDLTIADWDTTMAVNLDAPFLLGRRFGPGMAERGWGRIIHLASQQSLRAFGNSGAYGVSKAAICALTRSQAEAWSKHGVCVNALGPGFVETPLTEAVFADPARAEALAGRTMMGRNGTPEDFAGPALFLASDAARYMTGQTLFVDGGFSAT